jgi:hypothetical protein
MRDKMYISVEAHGNVVKAALPLRHIYRFQWHCPVCASRYEQFTKFANGATCPRCGHRFERLEFVTSYEKRIYPTLAHASDWKGKQLGALLPTT